MGPIIHVSCDLCGHVCREVVIYVVDCDWNMVDLSFRVPKHLRRFFLPSTGAKEPKPLLLIRSSGGGRDRWTCKTGFTSKFGSNIRSCMYRSKLKIYSGQQAYPTDPSMLFSFASCRLGLGDQSARRWCRLGSTEGGGKKVRRLEISFCVTFVFL